MRREYQPDGIAEQGQYGTSGSAASAACVACGPGVTETTAGLIGDKLPRQAGQGPRCGPLPSARQAQCRVRARIRGRAGLASARSEAAAQVRHQRRKGEKSHQCPVTSVGQPPHRSPPRSKLPQKRSLGPAPRPPRSKLLRSLTQVASVASPSRPMRFAAGSISCSSSSRLGMSDSTTLTTPVTLPLGRAKPAPTGSIPVPNTIGMVRVACFAANAAIGGGAKISSGLRATSSAASRGNSW